MIEVISRNVYVFGECGKKHAETITETIMKQLKQIGTDL
jgi:hypothetical protein